MQARLRRVPSTEPLDEAAIERALDRLRALVKERGLKASATREAIARAALERGGHFSVDDLVADLRTSRSADAHPATVYRVLPLLVDRKSTRLNSSHVKISYAVFCLKKKK